MPLTYTWYMCYIANDIGLTDLNINSKNMYQRRIPKRMSARHYFENRAKTMDKRQV